MKNYFIFALFLIASANAFSQNFTQTIRGRVTDKESQSAVPGVNIIVPGTEPLLGTTTDIDGYYAIENVPAGRINVQASFIGYEPLTFTNIELTTGKELVLNFELVEKVEDLQEVVITAGEDKLSANNEMASVSTRQFSVEESERYAGSRNDVSRMAQNFAGVRGSNDAVNDIVIRGNSPVGLLWRMEGIDIPNPNHFGDFGSTGGPVSMLNTNVLSNSDFLTSAFPAEYGNAISGAFDLQLRNGNIDKYEFLGQIGFNGLEFGAEGPINKNKRSSFLINYRYSTLGVFSALGIDFGTGTAIPYYQDLSFKLNFPLNTKHTISVFGLGGVSSVDLLTSKDTLNDNLYTDYVDVYNRVKTGVAGISHTWFIDNTSYTKFTLAATSMTQKNIVDSVSYLSYEPFDFYRQKFILNKAEALFFYKKKFNAKNSFEAGVRADDLMANVQDSISHNSGESYTTLTDFDGSAFLIQPYLQYQHKFSDALTINLGLHDQLLTLNGSNSLEPRFGLRYEINAQNILSAGYGLHSMMAPIAVYFQTQTNAEDVEYNPNEDIDFIRSQHFVVGYDHIFTENFHAKVEVYYQRLFDVVVDRDISSYSSLNTGSFNFGIPDSLQNTGTGENYGTEITIEKFLDRGFYFLTTASFYTSKYTGSDDVERNTAFAGDYVANALAGKEFYIGTKKVDAKFKKAIVFDTRFTAAGGQRYTPILLDASIAAGEAVYDNENAFSLQFPDYFRLDARLAFKLDGKHASQEWAFDVQNVTNHENPYSIRYNAVSQKITIINQLGLFPVMQYRITF